MNHVNDQSIWELHVRSVQGETLTAQETEQLQAWYDIQDKAEIEQLEVVHSAPEFSLQINETLGHIAAVTQNIKRLTEENEVIRQEIRELRRQLAKRHSLQPA